MKLPEQTALLVVLASLFTLVGVGLSDADAILCHQKLEGMNQCWNLGYYDVTRNPPPGGFKVVAGDKPLYIRAGFCKQVEFDVMVCCKKEVDGGC